MATKHFKLSALAAVTAALLAGCNVDIEIDDDADTGAKRLAIETDVMTGNEYCFNGGVRIDIGLDNNDNHDLEADEITSTEYRCVETEINEALNFNRIATFPVCSQIDENCNDDIETAAEIVAVTSDGMTLVYTDSPLSSIGFIDITNPEMPIADGIMAMTGEPTSVAVIGDTAFVGVSRSSDFINVAGSIEVVDISETSTLASFDIGGQPDSVAVSPDGNFVAVVIENERDEDLEVDGEAGALPQLPAGGFAILNVSDDNVDNWVLSFVDVTGYADIAGDDPEPEYVDINEDNIAVVTLQENNHILLIDLETAEVIRSFSAGSVDLEMVDATEEDLIIQNQDLDNVLREPDGVSWTSNHTFVTANEGDYNGGSRGFTVFDTYGNEVFESGAQLDHLAASIGHYPDARSENKGNEPENAEFGVFGDERFLFVNSERSSLVFVYDVADLSKPAYKQVLPAAAGPEGALAIPSRNLLIVASEEDNRGDKLRSAVNIYHYDEMPAQYPTIMSTERDDVAEGTPIPFGALSGLSADTQDNGLLYSIEDSFYNSNRIFVIDTDYSPARLKEEIWINDANDVFASFPVVELDDGELANDDVSRISVFDEADLAAMINEDKTVNIDPEGIAVASEGGFWIASEGNGTIGDESRPINTLNFIFKTDDEGTIEQVISLPAEINDKQLRFGFEGVTEADGNVYVAFQRVWADDTNVRIGAYNLASGEWSFMFYPLDAAESQDGGWVGLSDITALGNGKFLVLERDNKGGPDAAVKRLYMIDTTGLNDGDTVTKTLVRDVLPDLTKEHLTFEKVEGLAVMANGDVYLVNDNDGVDDNSGEIQLINLGDILPQ